MTRAGWRSVPASASVAAAISTAALLETVGAIHRLIATRLERDLSLFPATRARGAEHLALATSARAIRRRGSVAVIRRATIALRFARGAAIRAATRFGKPATRVEVLLATGESKSLTAIAAGQRCIGRHRDGSLRVTRPGETGKCRASVRWASQRTVEKRNQTRQDASSHQYNRTITSVEVTRS